MNLYLYYVPGQVQNANPNQKKPYPHLVTLPCPAQMKAVTVLFEKH